MRHSSINASGLLVFNKVEVTDHFSGVGDRIQFGLAGMMRHQPSFSLAVLEADKQMNLVRGATIRSM
jgi:hypothetical protein